MKLGDMEFESTGKIEVAVNELTPWGEFATFWRGPWLAAQSDVELECVRLKLRSESREAMRRAQVLFDDELAVSREQLRRTKAAKEEVAS